MIEKTLLLKFLDKLELEELLIVLAEMGITYQFKEIIYNDTKCPFIYEFQTKYITNNNKTNEYNFMNHKCIFTIRGYILKDIFILSIKEAIDLGILELSNTTPNNLEIMKYYADPKSHSYQMKLYKKILYLIENNQ